MREGGCKTSLSTGRLQRGTHTSDDLHEVLGVSLGEPPGWIHLVNHEGKTTCAKFLDKEVAEEVVVARKVLHVHNLGWSPCALEDGGAGACDRGRHGEEKPAATRPKRSRRKGKGRRRRGTMTRARTDPDGDKNKSLGPPAPSGPSNLSHSSQSPVRPASPRLQAMPFPLPAPPSPHTHRTCPALPAHRQQPAQQPPASIHSPLLHVHTSDTDGAFSSYSSSNTNMCVSIIIAAVFAYLPSPPPTLCPTSARLPDGQSSLTQHLYAACACFCLPVLSFLR